MPPLSKKLFSFVLLVPLSFFIIITFLIWDIPPVVCTWYMEELLPAMIGLKVWMVSHILE